MQGSVVSYREALQERDELRAATIRNYLRVTLCNIHDEFSKRMDAPALAAMLHRHGA